MLPIKMATKEVTVPELAKWLGCSIPRAQALIRTGAIRGRKGANGWVTPLSAVEAFLAKRKRAKGDKSFAGGMD